MTDNGGRRSRTARTLPAHHLGARWHRGQAFAASFAGGNALNFPSTIRDGAEVDARPARAEEASQGAAFGLPCDFFGPHASPDHQALSLPVWCHWTLVHESALAARRRTASGLLVPCIYMTVSARPAWNTVSCACDEIELDAVDLGEPTGGVSPPRSTPETNGSPAGVAVDIERDQTRSPQAVTPQSRCRCRCRIREEYFPSRGTWLHALHDKA